MKDIHHDSTQLQDTLLVIILGFAALVDVVIVAVVAWDLYAVKHSLPTVSSTTLALGMRHSWIAVLVTGELVLPIGILIGHLLVPQTWKP